MALKTIKINERDPKDSSDRVMFDLKVNVNQDGLFTAYLPPEIVQRFEESGIALKVNPARRSRNGFFSSNTMQGILIEINTCIAEYFSRELFKEEEIIKYDIQTTCAYGINANNDITPNCSSYDWAVDSEELNWRSGTVRHDSCSPAAFGILVYAEPFLKQTYKYKSGDEKIEYHGIYSNDTDKEKRPALYALSSVPNMDTPDGYGDNVKEIAYTEETAKFFIELLKSICRLNEKIKDQLDPKSLMEVIESGQKLLT